MNNSALRDAFKATKTGKLLMVEAKKQQSNIIGERIRNLKNLCYATFVAEIPFKAKRWDVYRSNKKGIRKLGIKGGWAYNNALSAVKFASTSKDALNDAIGILEKASL